MSRLQVAACCSISCLLLASSALAEEPGRATPRPANSVQADLGSGVIGLGYERVISDPLSLRVTAQLNRPWYTDILGGDESDVVGFGLEARPFVFPWAEAPRGLYVSPFGRVVSIRATDDATEELSGVGWSAGATVGYGWLWGERWLFRLGGGIQYWAFEIEDAGQRAGLEGLYPDVDIMVGYAF